jgi:hypothetical protein
VSAAMNNRFPETSAISGRFQQIFCKRRTKSYSVVNDVLVTVVY